MDIFHFLYASQFFHSARVDSQYKLLRHLFHTASIWLMETVISNRLVLRSDHCHFVPANVIKSSVSKGSEVSVRITMGVQVRTSVAKFEERVCRLCRNVVSSTVLPVYLLHIVFLISERLCFCGANHSLNFHILKWSFFQEM